MFSHGCAIRLLLAALQGLPLEELGRTPTGTNTAVSLLRAEGDRIEVVYRDDAAHLTDPAFTQGHARRPAGQRPGTGGCTSVPRQPDRRRCCPAGPDSL